MRVCVNHTMVKDHRCICFDPYSNVLGRNATRIICNFDAIYPFSCEDSHSTELPANLGDCKSLYARTNALAAMLLRLGLLHVVQLLPERFRPIFNYLLWVQTGLTTKGHQTSHDPSNTFQDYNVNCKAL